MSFSEEIKVAARIYSFQMLMKVRMHTVITGGIDTGKIILRKIRYTLAPSINADSSISCGISLMNPERMNTAIGVEKAM
ncbi:hypothetical protein D3C73_1527630 [compost metagenome]